MKTKQYHPITSMQLALEKSKLDVWGWGKKNPESMTDYGNKKYSTY